MKFLFTTTWTSEIKYADSPSISYEESGVTYNGNYNYNGNELTTWTNEQIT